MRHLILFISVLAALSVAAQEPIWIRPNKGQWNQEVSHRIKIPNGTLFLEEKGWTFSFYNLNEYREQHLEGHEHEGHQHSAEDFTWKYHNVKATFLNASQPDSIVGADEADFYENYFLGKDTNHWVSHLKPVQKVRYYGLYPGIDMEFYGVDNALKYDFYLDAGANPYDIRLNYEGQQKMFIDDDGNLNVATRFGTIKESAPTAYQLIRGRKKKLKIKFKISSNNISFGFPEGFDPDHPLVIDPQLTFSTFTGATSDNWGYTACPDRNENLIGGGIVFGPGYPTNSGSYDVSYNGGQSSGPGGIPGFDVAISKFNPQGSALVYSTFLGGANNEAPHSVIVNNQNELMIYGSTSSDDFSVTPTAYQDTHGGGSAVTVSGLYYSKSDIFVAKLSPNGDNLLASTYLGGSSNDGLNTGLATRFNYGDESRGEVMVDDQQNVYVASSTQSTDFPMVMANQNTYNGDQSGVAFKFSPNLNTLLWSTYIRGNSGTTASFGIQLSSTNEIYITGATDNNAFPTTGGAYQTAYQGGATDGYIHKYDPLTFTLLSSTLVGTTGRDLTYFVQLDPDDFVYVFGQSDGNYPITPGKYNNAGGGQFIHKFSNDLNTSEFSTRVGGANGAPQISPTAFLVSDCYNIFIAGWGGATNQGNVITSTTTNFPTTNDAFQSNTNGNNFYLALYTDDMTSLKYATYMGGLNSSNNHVDGGTSRFDKRGVIYHAVCGSCGATNSGFTSTPGAYSETSNSNNCNLAAFKFDLGFIDALISTPQTFVCFPDPAEFINNSQNVNEFFWDFGDGNTSTQEEPIHNYPGPGTYEVTLIVNDSTECFIPDTARIDVIVSQFVGDAYGPPGQVCPGDTVQLIADGGDLSDYAWFPGTGLSDSTIAEPTAVITEDITYGVVMNDSCGIDTAYVTIEVYDDFPDPLSDTSICIGNSVDLIASGGTNYTWTSNNPTFPATNNAQITVSPTNDQWYFLEGTTPSGCDFYDTVLVEVDYTIPIPQLPDTVGQCRFDTTFLEPGIARDYSWSPPYNIFVVDTTDNYNMVWPLEDTMYYVTLTNACGDNFDSVYIDVTQPEASAVPDTTICPEGEAVLTGYGGASYRWFPSATLNTSENQTVIARPSTPTTYYVEVTDSLGCRDTAEVFVDIYPSPLISVVSTVYAVEDEYIQLEASGTGEISWSPPESISCVVCDNPLVMPNQTTSYTATVTDTNGCQATDQVTVIYEGQIYVPNTFTPDRDNFNEVFKPIGYNIREYELLIFNRWGELIFESQNLEVGWDGTFRGKLMQDGTYVWKITYKDISNNKLEKFGHVNLLK